MAPGIRWIMIVVLDVAVIRALTVHRRDIVADQPR
jgi:hypothetical protein